MRGMAPSGLIWLVDPLGAALFAFGLASSISALAWGAAPSAPFLAAMVAGGLVRAGAQWSAQRQAIGEAQRAGCDLRQQLFRRMLGEPLGRPVSLGQAAVLAIDHVATVEQYAARFVPLRLAAVAAPLLVAALVAIASPVSAAILIATLVPFVIGMILTGTLAGRAADRQLGALGQLSELFVDRIRTLPIIRHFGAEERIGVQVAAATRAMADRTIEVLRLAFLSSAVLEFFAALSVALVAVYCGFSLLGLLPFPAPEVLEFQGALFALAMAPEFYLPMRRLAAAYHEKQLGEAAHKDLAPFLGPSIKPEGHSARFAGVAASGLTVAWPGRNIGPVSFAVGTRGMIALTGPTGSGKTSLLAAIAGQIVPATGTVTPLASESVAWAAQHPLIVPGSLRDNLALAAPDANDDAIRNVCRQVGLDALLDTRAEGLDLPLDHRGSGISGGERRRVAIARAILSGRPVLLCDEPTADLDDTSAEAIMALLCDLAETRSIIVATHDARLLARAEAVVML